MADNPLLKALPPETDYLSYLTILEYNLIPDQLPTLHHILQDTTLTANIGWDLVHLLLPLLPASQQCLQDVARLGNPREVVLKVTELLEEIAGPDEEDDESGSGSIDESETKAPAPRVNETEGKGRDGEEAAPVSANLSQPSLSPSKVVRFNALLEMLAILHPRIKTKYPSRFLSTSLRTVLPAYLQVSKHVESTEAVLKFINALSGTKRPPLPPRNNSSVISTPANAVSAPDPEDHDEVLDLGEMALQLRLLQSFLTFFVDCFMVTTMLDEDVPGLAWSSRYQEKLNPQKIIPDRRTYNSLFAEDERLHHRDSLIGQTLVSII